MECRRLACLADNGRRAVCVPSHLFRQPLNCFYIWTEMKLFLPLLKKSHETFLFDNNFFLGVFPLQKSDSAEAKIYGDVL